MGLTEADQIPKGVSLDKAYSAIYAWYSTNPATAPQSVALAAALPPPATASTAEKKVALAEVIYGYLEWAYHRSDGKFKMAAYAHGYFDGAGLRPPGLSQGERQSFASSPMAQRVLHKP